MAWVGSSIAESRKCSRPRPTSEDHIARWWSREALNFKFKCCLLLPHGGTGFWKRMQKAREGYDGRKGCPRLREAMREAMRISRASVRDRQDATQPRGLAPFVHVVEGRGRVWHGGPQCEDLLSWSANCLAVQIRSKLFGNYGKN